MAPLRIVALALVAAVALLLAIAITLRSRSDVRQLEESLVAGTYSSSRAVLASYERFADHVVRSQIAIPEITSVIAEGITTGDFEIARERLYYRMAQLHADLERQEFRQLHFHLPGGRSLLRMHAVERWGDPLVDVRESIRLVNETLEKVIGFEEGRIFNGYRYVYPLFNGATHVGSVELSISYAAVARTMAEEFGGAAELLIRRDVIATTVFTEEVTNYTTTPFSDDYLADVGLVEPGEREIERALVASMDKRELAKLRTGESFAARANADGSDYAVVFLSVHDIAGEQVGYFVTYDESNQFRILHITLIARLMVLSAIGGATVLAILMSERARRAAEAGNEAKGAFLANVSHDLRTPLSGVLGMISILEDERGSESERREAIRLLRQAGEDLLHMVNSILEMSRLNAGRMDIRPRPTDLHELVADLVATMARSAEAEDLSVRVRTNPDVPRLVWTDPLRLRQILTNCVHNAIKFTRSGGVTVAVGRSAVKNGNDDSLVDFTITDTGVGIAQDELERVFEGYVQSDGAQEGAFGGTGLGLSIVRGLVELMGGSVSLRSIVNVGTTVRVTLPFREASEEEDASSRSPVRAADDSRVLVAEDDPISLRAIELMLTSRGIAVCGASTEEEVVDMASSGDFSLLLLDQNLRHGTGQGAARRLLDAWDQSGSRAVPIVALSGAADPESRRRWEELGVSSVLSKPARADDIVALLQEPHIEPPFDTEVARVAFPDLEELIREVLPVFVAQAKDRLQAMNLAVAAHDASAIHAQTHPMKTSSRYLGANELSRVAEELDELTRHGTVEWGRVEPMVGSIAAQIAAIESWLERVRPGT